MKLTQNISRRGTNRLMSSVTLLVIRMSGVSRTTSRQVSSADKIILFFSISRPVWIQFTSATRTIQINADNGGRNNFRKIYNDDINLIQLLVVVRSITCATHLFLCPRTEQYSDTIADVPAFSSFAGQVCR